MPEEFLIQYAIPDDEWRIVASGGPGLEGEPAFNFLKGTVGLEVQGKSPWARRFDVSVADLALQFLSAIESGFPSTADKALVSETDGGIDLHLERVDNRVHLRVSPYPVRADISARAYAEGVERFLRQFATELRRRAPRALVADELAPLADWAS
jgi:hypothetical protein